MYFNAPGEHETTLQYNGDETRTGYCTCYLLQLYPKRLVATVAGDLLEVVVGQYEHYHEHNEV